MLIFSWNNFTLASAFIILSTSISAAATAAKSLQSCSTLCDPHRRQPTRLPHPWDSPGKNTGVGCLFLLQCMKVKSESEVTQSCLTLSDLMDHSLPGSSLHGISRQKYWSGVPLPSPTPLSSIHLKINLFKAFPTPVKLSTFRFSTGQTVEPPSAQMTKPEI